MNCKKCGNPLIEGATFCSACGEAVAKSTPVAPVNSSEPVQPPVANPNGPVPPSNPVAPVAGNPALGQVAQPAAPVDPAMPTPTVNPSGAPIGNNKGVTPPENKKNNNMIFMIVCGFLVLIIIVLVVLVLNSGNSSNNDKSKDNDTNKTNEVDDKKSTTSSTTTSSTSTTRPRVPVEQTSGSYTDYYGIQLYVPETFTAQSQGDTITLISNSKRQMIALQVGNYSYDEVSAAFDQYITGIESSGFVSTTKEQSNYKGMKYSVVRGTLSGASMSTGYADFGSGYTAMFAFRTDYATENDHLESLLQIVTNSRSTASFSKGDKDSGNVSSFIKDSSKLSVE